MFKNESNDICGDVVGFANDYSFIEQASQKIRPTSINKENVSIIIPFFERREKLKLVLEGLCNQTIKSRKMEILICDDGSLVDVGDILIGFQKKFKKIKHLRNKKNGFGLSKVRNIGMNHASHSNMILLDDDMIPTHNLVESHLRILLSNPHTISIGFRKHQVVEGMNIQDILSQSVDDEDLDWRVKGVNIEDLNRKIKYDPYYCWSIASGGNVAFTKKVVEDKIFFDEMFDTWGGEDNEWAYRLYKLGYYFFPNYQAIAIHQDDVKIENKKNAKSMQLLMSKCPRINDVYKVIDYSSNDIPLFSFWMCNNNRAEYIKQAIQSISKFPYRHEIVVVDDGSTDGSIGEIMSLNLQNIRLIRIPKSKLGYVYKVALDACRGEYLIQLDSDDYIDNLANLVEICAFAATQPYGLVYGHHFQVDQEGKFLSDGWIHDGCHREKLLFNGMHIHPPRIISKRDYSRARDIDIELENAVDYDLYSKIIEISYGYFYNLNTYAYRQHPQSVSSNNLESQKNNVAKIIADRLIHYGVFDKYSFDDKIKRSCVVKNNGFDILNIRNRRGLISNENF
jgi:chondroitin synthase